MGFQFNIVVLGNINMTLEYFHYSFKRSTQPIHLSNVYRTVQVNLKIQSDGGRPTNFFGVLWSVCRSIRLNENFFFFIFPITFAHQFTLLSVDHHLVVVSKDAFQLKNAWKEKVMIMTDFQRAFFCSRK